MKTLDILNKIYNIVISIFLMLVILYGVYAIWDTYDIFRREEVNHDNLKQYKPVQEGIDINQSILRAMVINPDICGWITIDNTNIDYLFVQGKNNYDYINLDVYKKYSLSGSIFLDYRCDMSFNIFNSIMYGHHMQNGSMFSDLKKFNEKEFFDNNQTGTLYLADRTYKIQLFSYMAVGAYDNIIFNPYILQENEKNEFLNYIKTKSIHYREIGITSQDKIITLTTCSSDFTNARSVLLGKLTN